MYKHYCKDSNCQGHTKSWERCCDMRAFGQTKNDRKKDWPSSVRNPFPGSTTQRPMTFI